MATLQIYEKLLLFPLFQGMSRDDLEQVAGHTRFGFSKISAGATVIAEGDDCRQLYLLINGTLQTERYGDNKAYFVTERLSAPHLLEFERLFGIRQIYKCSYTALTDVNLITIDKQEVMLLLETQLVFRLNMLNIMATEIQRLARSRVDFR